MEIDLGNLSNDVLISIVQDLNNYVFDLRKEIKEVNFAINCARDREKWVELAVTNWKNKFFDLQYQKLPHGESEVKSALIDQLCEIARSLDSHGALTLLGIVYEMGSKIKAVKAYRLKNKVTIKEAKETVENWRNILGPPEDPSL